MSHENFIIKDWRNVDLSFGLVYPNVHEIGMSSYTIRLLYYLINSYPNIVCERFFLPERIKYPAHLLTDPRNHVRSLENKVLLRNFDMVGFTLQFENDFRNILWLLEDSLIPITWQERQKLIKDKGVRLPLVIAGGPVATSNPIPFSPFFDIMVIGDFEPSMNSFFNLIEEYINEEIDYEELLKNLQSIEGIFIPLLDNTVRRAVQEDLNDAPVPEFQVFSKSNEKKRFFEDNYFLEVNRGCPFSCKFCISSFHNSPFRNRKFETLIRYIDFGLEHTNFNRFSLIGPCVSAHPKFLKICEYILAKNKNFTIPSIRIEHIDSAVIKILEKNGTKTITIAPETGSERLRHELGKIIPNAKIFEVLNKIRESSIRNVKLYFLIGLPGEKQIDIQDTIDFLKKMNDIGFNRDSLRVNINPFIPKLNTPYEKNIHWFLNENISTLRKNFQKIEEELKNLQSVRLKFKNPNVIIKNARLQALISLGNENIAELLKNYYLEGANLGSLRRAEKNWGSTINDYFKKIESSYLPKKIW